MNISVFGAGNWGSAFAKVLSSKELNHKVTLYGREHNIARLYDWDTNTFYNLISTDVIPTSEIKQAADCELMLIAVPFVKLNDLMKDIAACNCAKPKYIISLVKGFESHDFSRATQIISKYLPGVPVGMLSGPNIAYEIMQDKPAASVLAFDDIAIANELIRQISTSRFRVYSSSDVTGVELCGAIKNILAIGSGVIESVNLGENARAAFITRGMAEMTNIITSLGGKKETISGLAGIGDVMLSCYSPDSRNHKFGRLFMSMSQDIDATLAQINSTVEGLNTLTAIHNWGKANNKDLPITNGLYQLIYEKASVTDVVSTFMSRELKSE